MLLFFLMFLIIPSILSTPFANNNRPICTMYIPNSILEHTRDFIPHLLEERMRYSTCTGAAWFHENYLALLNLHGKKITTYFFNRNEQRAHLIQEITNEHGTQLSHPENLVVSPDGTLLAVCSDSPSPGVKLYSIDTLSHFINPTPILTIPAQQLVHNVRFTHDGAYLATTEWDDARSLRVYKLLRDDIFGKRLAVTLRQARNIRKNQHRTPTVDYRLEQVCVVPNHLMPKKPKGINFTKDGRYAVVCYAPCVTTDVEQSHSPRESTLISYSFDNTTGQLGNAISSTNLLSSTEDITFLSNDTAVMVTDQAADRLFLFSFDPQTGHLGTLPTIVANPLARLSFPHGIGVSQDEKFVAVVNYGDDSCNIYEVAQS